MLSQGFVHAMVPTKDMEASRAFYEQKLGLKPDDRLGGEAVRYACGEGSWFLLFKSYVEIAGEQTVAQWLVKDLEAEVAALKSNGVSFVDYDLPEIKTADSIMTLPEGAKVAWFKDPSGNTLGMGQFPGL